MSKVQEDIIQLMKSFFKNDSLIVSEETTANDIEEWDSLNHMNFISEVEKHFNIQFEFFEIMDLENVGELIDSILQKLNS